MEWCTPKSMEFHMDHFIGPVIHFGMVGPFFHDGFAASPKCVDPMMSR